MNVANSTERIVQKMQMQGFLLAGTNFKMQALLDTIMFNRMGVWKALKSDTHCIALHLERQ